MEHGRDHDERRQRFKIEGHSKEGRYNNTPPEPADDEEDIDRGALNGSEPAPTERAADREAERHRLEREAGHFAAGTGGRHEVDAEPVSREELDEAARRADESVTKKT